jgi:hypothetical protein
MLQSNRTRRATLKARATAARAAARIHRNGAGTLASHCMAQGLNHRDAASVAGTLRKLAAKIGVVGTRGRIHAGRHMRNCARYTPIQVGLICLTYRPRKPAYKVVAAKLALAA